MSKSASCSFTCCHWPASAALGFSANSFRASARSIPFGKAWARLSNASEISPANSGFPTAWASSSAVIFIVACNSSRADSIVPTCSLSASSNSRASRNKVSNSLGSVKLSASSFISSSPAANSSPKGFSGSKSTISWICWAASCCCSRISLRWARDWARRGERTMEIIRITAAPPVSRAGDIKRLLSHRYLGWWWLK